MGFSKVSQSRVAIPNGRIQEQRVPLISIRIANIVFSKDVLRFTRVIIFPRQGLERGEKGKGKKNGEMVETPSDKVYGRPFPRMRLHSSIFNLAKRTQLPRVIPSCYFLIGHQPEFSKRNYGGRDPHPPRRRRERRNLTVISPRYSIRMGKIWQRPRALNNII